MNLLELARSATVDARPTPSVSPKRCRRWSVSFDDGRAPVEVIYSDDQTRAEVEERYPGGAVEPVSKAPRTATAPEVDELRRLIGIVLAHATAQERQEALAASVGDVDDALTSFRALAGDLSGPPATVKV